jgi:hypothetical protein
MKAILIYILISVAALCIAMFMAVSMPQPGYKVINCGVSEISPDFTNEMREACRRARMEQIK